MSIERMIERQYTHILEGIAPSHMKASRITALEKAVCEAAKVFARSEKTLQLSKRTNDTSLYHEALSIREDMERNLYAVVDALINAEAG